MNFIVVVTKKPGTPGKIQNAPVFYAGKSLSEDWLFKHPLARERVLSSSEPIYRSSLRSISILLSKLHFNFDVDARWQIETHQ